MHDPKIGFTNCNSQTILVVSSLLSQRFEVYFVLLIEKLTQQTDNKQTQFQASDTVQSYKGF